MVLLFVVLFFLLLCDLSDQFSFRTTVIQHFQRTATHEYRSSGGRLCMVFDFLKQRTAEGFAQVQNIAAKTIEGKLGEALLESVEYIKKRQEIDVENLRRLTDGFVCYDFVNVMANLPERDFDKVLHVHEIAFLGVYQVYLVTLMPALMPNCKIWRMYSCSQISVYQFNYHNRNCPVGILSLLILLGSTTTSTIIADLRAYARFFRKLIDPKTLLIFFIPFAKIGRTH